ncbi:MAG: acetylxylan esterase, partial [bacterium]|nr:acetylxylan esterase [bacterium]
MGKDFPEFKYYPSAEEVDDWVASVWELVEETDCAGEVLNEQGFSHNLGIRHFDGFQYVRFTPEGMDPFYGYWQPALSGPAPLLIHVPGYGAEMSVHPDLVAAGFNVLHVCPLGYSTPEGADESKKRDGAWPVLPDTILSGGEKGYKFWLANVALAARWAMEREEVIPDRVSFLGSSQGGGCALLLASVFRDRGVRCVGADVPYLTNFPLAAGRGAYGLAARTLQGMSDPKAGWRAMGLIDTLSHAHRLTCPVLLVAGG